MIRRFVDDKITYINSDLRWKGSNNVVKFCVLIGNLASEKLRFYLSKPYLRIGGPEWRKFQGYSSDVGDAVTGSVCLCCCSVRGLSFAIGHVLADWIARKYVSSCVASSGSPICPVYYKQPVKVLFYTFIKTPLLKHNKFHYPS